MAAPGTAVHWSFAEALVFQGLERKLAHFPIPAAALAPSTRTVHPASRSNPELLYCRAEDAVRERELFAAILDELEPAARAVLTLVEVDRLSHEDAAAKMG